VFVFGMAPCEQNEQESFIAPTKNDNDTIKVQGAEPRSADQPARADGIKKTVNTDSEAPGGSDGQERRRTMLRCAADALLVVCGAACGGCVVTARGCADVAASTCSPKEPTTQIAVVSADNRGSGTNSNSHPEADREEDGKAVACTVNDATEDPPESTCLPYELEPIAQAVKPVAETPPLGTSSLQLRQRQWEMKDHHQTIANDRSGFVPGATLEVLHATIMREGQSLKSPKICEFEAGALLVVLDLGEGRRIKVEALSTGQAGWVSTRDQSANRRLLALKYLSPGTAVGPGAVVIAGVDHLIMRKEMDPESEKICDCPKNDRLRVIEEPVGRYVKVERIGTGEIGWISASSEKCKVRDIKLVEEMPWRREGFAIGAQIESLRSAIVRTKEATSSKVIGEYGAGEEFVVFELGAGCRMHVRHHSGTVGWVSSASAHGGFLFSVKRESLVPGQCVEATSAVIVREGVDLASPEIEEIQAGAKAVILDAPEGRRVKVRLVSSGKIGWASVLTKKGQWLLRPENAPVAAAPVAPLAVCKEETPSECASQGDSVHTPIKQCSAPLSTHEEVGESDGEETKVRTSALRRVLEKVAPVCSAVAAVLGGAALLVISAVGTVVAAPFYGCYIGATGCATCGSAICQRCRPQGSVASSSHAQSAAPTSESKDPKSNIASQGGVTPSDGTEHGTKVRDRAGAQDLNKLLRIELKPVSGCFLCSFATMSLKE